MRDSWFDAVVRWFDRAPGPRWLAFAAITVVLAILLHAADWVDAVDPFRIQPDLVIGAASLPLMLWVTLALNDVAGRALERLRPALDQDAAAETAIAADLVRTPNWLAVPAIVIAIVAGALSVLESPENWGIHPDHPGFRFVGAIALSIVTDMMLLGLMAHIVHQLRIVTRIHRSSVRIDLFHLAPLYAFSTLTAWTGIGLIVIVVGLIAALSLSIGRFLLSGAADLALTGSIFVVATACFVLPLLGLHGRIADVKDARIAEAQSTLEVLVAEVRNRVANGDLEGAGKLKDPLLAAESSVAAIARISTWPWRTETLRAFVSAVLLPIGLFIVYEILRRALPQ
jgi:hypothetical protein